MMVRVSCAFVGLLCAGIASGQSRFLIADRTSDALYLLRDANSNGLIDEPGEVSLWFSAANAAGTPGPMNPTALAVGPGGVCVMGDQGTHRLYWLQDLNGDLDAQDADESRVVFDDTNAAGISLAFPTGAALPFGKLFVVNAGNAFGNDAVYRFDDDNGDGDFQDAGEIAVYVGEPVFEPGNGPYSPQELGFGGPAGYLRNSSSGLHGVYRFQDGNANNHADDEGEFETVFDASNASGITPSAGFALELDAHAAGLGLYTHQIASGGVDQIVRLEDNNADDDAQDAGEAQLAFETAESGFSAIDLLSLRDGRLLVTDNSGKRVIVLRDLDGDNLFTSPGERGDFFANAMSLVADVRQIALLPTPCAADTDLDLDVDLADLANVLAYFGSNCDFGPCVFPDVDLNDDNTVDLADLAILLSNFGDRCS